MAREREVRDVRCLNESIESLPGSSRFALVGFPFGVSFSEVYKQYRCEHGQIRKID
jgi:hypothetical protein